MATSIGSTYAIGIWSQYIGIGGICNRGIYAKGTFVESIKSGALAGSEVILINSRVNDNCFILSINFIFISTESASCCSIGS